MASSSIDELIAFFCSMMLHSLSEWDSETLTSALEWALVLEKAVSGKQLLPQHFARLCRSINADFDAAAARTCVLRRVLLSSIASDELRNAAITVYSEIDSLSMIDDLDHMIAQETRAQLRLQHVPSHVHSFSSICDDASAALLIEHIARPSEFSEKMAIVETILQQDSVDGARIVVSALARCCNEDVRNVLESSMFQPSMETIFEQILWRLPSLLVSNACRVSTRLFSAYSEWLRRTLLQSVESVTKEEPPKKRFPKAAREVARDVENRLHDLVQQGGFVALQCQKILSTLRKDLAPGADSFFEVLFSRLGFPTEDVLEEDSSQRSQ